jgi:hypothetical protein
MAIEKPSTTSVAADAPIAIYSNSPEINDLGPNYRRVIPGNTVGPLYLGSQNTDFNEIDLSLSLAEDSLLEDEASDETSSVVNQAAPYLSDIQLTSNTVVYDDAGNPSVSLVFKIKNSSGKTLKGMNARVELK